MFDTTYKTVEKVMDQEAYYNFLDTLETRLCDALEEHYNDTSIESQDDRAIKTKFLEKKIATYEFMLAKCIENFK